MALILVVFAALALTYSFVTRLKYAPDEPAHFIYIRSLATNHTPPPISHVDTPHEDSESTHEGHQPPLYYALMAIPFALLRGIGASDEVIWRVLRLLSLPVGLMWIVSVRALAREYFDRDSYALATAAFVALIPTSSYMAGVISNEMLITLLFTSAMLPILRYFKTGAVTPHSAAVLGVLIGLASLAKAQGLLLIPLLFVAALLVTRRRGYSTWLGTLRTLGIVLGVAAMVAGWWFIRCWIVHGTPLPTSLTEPVFKGGFGVLLLWPVSALSVIFYSTAAAYVYAWLPFWIIWPYVSTMMPTFWVLAALTVIMLTGLVIRVRRGKVDVRSLGILFLSPVLVYCGWLRYTLFVDKWANMQGRLFLSIAAVVGITWILGFDGLLSSARAKKIGAVAGVVGLLGANAGVIACAVSLYR